MQEDSLDKEPLEDEYQIATIGKRISSFFIDNIVISLFWVAIFYNQLSEIREPVALSLFLQENFLVFILLKLIYHTFFVWQSGMTPGKMLVKIQIIELDSGRIPSLGVAFLRSSLRVVSESVFFLGYLMAYFTPLVQTLHDKLTRTVVVDA